MNTKRNLFLLSTLCILQTGFFVEPVLVQRDVPENFFTNTYVVPPTFMELLDESKTRPTAVNISESAGILFAPGCSAVYSASKLAANCS